MILFRKIANVSLALLLLVATTGVTLNKHYCMGRLKSVAIFQSANTCIENELANPMPCCQDISEELKIDNLTKASFDFKSSPGLYQLAVINYVLLNQDLISIEKDKSKFHHYSSPLPDQNLLILNQSFLI